MKGEKKSQVICISGASAGIGAAIAELFARRGWHVVIGARRMERLNEMRAHLQELGARKVTVLPLDVTSDESVGAFASKTIQEIGGSPDVVVNNAGLAIGVATLAQGDIRDWSLMVETNIMGLLRFVRAFLPAMVEAGRGHVVNMGSIAGHACYDGGNVYVATKHAVRAINQCLRLDLSGTPIRVSSIDPGMVETEFSFVRFSGDAERAKSVYKGMTPLRGQDIAECVAFVVDRPPHVNIDNIVIMPTDQAAVNKVYRRS